jgi:hypothetical protein
MASIADIFKCTVCNGSRVEAITVEAVVRTEILSIDGAGNAEYGKMTHRNGRVNCHRCMDCGCVVSRAGLEATARYQEGADCNSVTDQEG